jgi:transposase
LAVSEPKRLSMPSASKRTAFRRSVRPEDAPVSWDLPSAVTPNSTSGRIGSPTHGVSAQALSIALENFAREVGAGKKKSIVLVVDKAAWHTAKKDLELPEGIHLEYLPSHCQELQPSERLWPLSNEGVANRYFEQIEELEEELGARCVALSDKPELIRSYTRYHWWPRVA